MSTISTSSPAGPGGRKPRHVLMVAYHFPPIQGSSGYLRTLKFCKYLVNENWITTVLTTHPRAYERSDSGQLSEIPPQVKVVRAFALDTPRHLAIRGRYPAWLALPDRWVAWLLGALPAGVAAVRRDNIELIYSTFPVATAVLIGALLHRLTGKPWIADFRDSMTEEHYPADPTKRRVYRWIERQAVQHASRLIFTAESARKMYLERYPSLDPAKCVVIANGYDEQDFAQLAPVHGGANGGRPLRLLHAGLIYPSERDPRPFFRALARLKRERALGAESLQVDLRASGHDAEYQKIVNELDIGDIVHLLPPVPYRQVLQEGAEADAALLFQAANCNHQIPAKAYEYIRLGKPILALTDSAGDTAALLSSVGGSTIVNIANEEEIARRLPSFLQQVRSGTHSQVIRSTAEQYSRQAQARQLAALFSQVCG